MNALPTQELNRCFHVANVLRSGLVSKVGNTSHLLTANELVEVDKRSGEAMDERGGRCASKDVGTYI